jgi:Cyanobactin oxidase ThcOx,
VSSIHFIPIPEGHSGLRARKTKRGRRAAPPTISARLGSHVSLEAHANGHIVACFGGHSVDLGAFSAAAAASAQDLRIGRPVASVSSGGRNIDKEIYVLVRRLARRGLLEYSLSNSRNDEDQVVIEPQVADYWPKNPPLGNTDVLVLSRFAYMRRRGNDMVLESPRADALFRICNTKIATAIAALSTPQQIRRFRRQDGFPGIELLALLVDCQILFKTEATTDRVITTSSFGTFTIFCSTRVARKADTPTQ